MTQQDIWNRVCERITGPRLMSNPERYNRLTHPERVALACFFADLHSSDLHVRGAALVGQPSGFAVAWADWFAVTAEELHEGYEVMAALWGTDNASMAGDADAAH